MFKKIQKKLLVALDEKVQKQPLTLLEKKFLTDNGITIDIKNTKWYTIIK